MRQRWWNKSGKMLNSTSQNKDISNAFCFSKVCSAAVLPCCGHRRWHLCAEYIMKADTLRRQQSPPPLTLKSWFHSATLKQRSPVIQCRRAHKQTGTHTKCFFFLEKLYFSSDKWSRIQRKYLPLRGNQWKEFISRVSSPDKRWHKKKRTSERGIMTKLPPRGSNR